MSGTGDDTAVGSWPQEVNEMLVSAGHRQSAGDQETGRGIGLAAAADRWTVGRADVYRFDSGAGAEQDRFIVALSDMAERAGAAGFATPTVIDALDRWVVVEGPAGITADRPELHPDPDDLITAVGAGMRALHQLPIDRAGERAVPGGDWDAVAELCRRSVEGGPLDNPVLDGPLDNPVLDKTVDRARLPAPYDRYSPEELLRFFVDGAPAQWEPVICHGFAAAERFVVDSGRFVGFNRLEAPLVADRHFDLAVIHQSVQHHFGPEAVFRFYEAYGRDPDVVRLEHYVLASHLLGRSSIETTSGTTDR